MTNNTQSVEKNTKRTISKFLSNTFQPVLVPTYASVVLAFFDPLLSPYLPLNFKFLIIGIVLLFTGIIPAGVVLTMLWLGKVEDGFISNKDQRTLPYLLSLIGYVAGIYVLWAINMPGYWIGILIGAAVALLLILFINFKWKISAHAATMGGVCGGFIILGILFNINNVFAVCAVVLLSGLVCSSRIYLKAHTLGQVLLGWLLGALVIGGSTALMY